jgi:hypothetical protein
MNNTEKWPGLWLALFGLAVLMVATRYHHLGSALHLPDASMAVFFLGGLLASRMRACHWAFAGFMTLAVLIDAWAVGLDRVSDHCITLAYAFLLPAYATLWYAGRSCGWPTPHARPLLRTLAVGLLAASLSFLISNGAFYWLGGRYAEPHFAEYLARVWQWGPLFVRTTMGWLLLILTGYALVAHGLVLRSRAVARSA